MMKHFRLSFLLLLAAGLFFTSPLSGQNDILGGIFEQEEPVFFATVSPSEKPGEVKLEYYFTHSKLSSLEVSFWIKDLGTAFRNTGERVLVRGLEETGNREQKTISIEGLKDQHFYTIGVDYRNSRSLVRKFSSAVLEEGYLYRKPEEVSQVEPVRKNDQQPPAIQRPAAAPCVTPDITVLVEPSGYCGANNRPAVLVQCTNCQGRNWEFSVEIRNQWEDWRTLRTDGRRQSAIGVSPRTEPLCTVRPGEYFVRVKAWGQGCETPVINSVAAPIVIADPRQVTAEAQPPAADPATGRDWSRKSAQTLADLPDTCHVAGRAVLQGGQIRGVLRLESYSPCQAHNPFAKIVYVHPAHRNITLDMVPLRAGESTPFSIPLDDRDLNRGIHTIQVITHIKPDPNSESIPLGSFWLKAERGSAEQLARGKTPPPPTPPPGYYSGNDPKPNASSEYEQGRRPAAKTGEAPAGSAPYESSISEDFETVNVRATDPNCNQIQDLQLVYNTDQPNLPLYISWLSPRCCQEDGCDYTIWAGRNPEKMRLVISGNKSGALIREILQGIQYNDEYFEVAVKTSNGTRKAAYLLGKGPVYGVEEVLTYHDQFNPQKSDPLIAAKGDEGLTADANGAAAFEVDPAPVITYQEPSMPISDFIACKYKRETIVEAEQPVLDGDEITIQYDFSDRDYQHTLYYRPAGREDWVIAPGTKELQDDAGFRFRVNKYSSGEYLILTYSPGKNWGCLSAPVEEAVELKVEE